VRDGPMDPHEGEGATEEAGEPVGGYQSSGAGQGAGWTRTKAGEPRKRRESP
jgi:hypothetical protein